MSLQLPSTFQFIQKHLPSNTKGLGITTLSKRNFFQSIGDYFSEKSGKNRVSYVAVGDDFITRLHFQGEDLIAENTIQLGQLDHFYVSEGQTADGIIHHLSCDATVIVSAKKMVDHHIKILPCLFLVHLCMDPMFIKKRTAPSDGILPGSRRSLEPCEVKSLDFL